MVFKFKIISDKVEDFILHLDADARNSFFDLHEAIQVACKYDSGELATFYMADEEWDPGEEISMFENKSQKHPARLMKQTTLGDMLTEQEGQLIYIFDITNRKSLYIQLNKIVMDEQLNSPIVSYNRGMAPAQSPLKRSNADLLADQDLELQNVFTDFGELEDLNLIYGEIGEVM